MTKLVYIILFVCSASKISSAYPLDYNETTIEELDNALSEFQSSVLQTSFPKLLNDFQIQVVPISLDVYEKISKLHEQYSYRLIEIEENANILNANLSDCTDTRSISEVEELYSVYESDCEKIITDIGKNIVSIGYNKQNVVFLRKYSDLMHYYKGCVSTGDPAPSICIGVIAATLEEVQRIIPVAKTYGFETERALKQQLVNLSECAKGKLSDLNKKVHNEFDKVVNCVLSKVTAV